jgi:hypothetical protein
MSCPAHIHSNVIDTTDQGCCTATPFVRVGLAPTFTEGRSNANSLHLL